MLGTYHREQATPVLKKKSVWGALALLAVLGLLGAFVFFTAQPQVTPLALAHFKLEEEEFKHFVEKHGKEYENAEEYLARFKIYRDNAAFIRLFNAQGKNWTLGINEFADWSFEEFKGFYLPNPYKQN